VVALRAIRGTYVCRVLYETCDLLYVLSSLAIRKITIRRRIAIKQLLLSTCGLVTDLAVKEIQAGVRKILENIESTRKLASYATAVATRAGIA